jgi:hypothetical protein
MLMNNLKVSSDKPSGINQCKYSNDVIPFVLKDKSENLMCAKELMNMINDLTKFYEEKVIINQPKTTKTIEYETEAPAPKATVQQSELNIRIQQRIKEKEKRIYKLIENAF